MHEALHTRDGRCGDTWTDHYRADAGDKFCNETAAQVPALSRKVYYLAKSEGEKKGGGGMETETETDRQRGRGREGEREGEREREEEERKKKARQSLLFEAGRCEEAQPHSGLFSHSCWSEKAPSGYHTR